MADQLPEPPEAPREGHRWQHDWHPYEDYRNVHVSYMDRLFGEQVVLHDHLDFIEIHGEALDAVQIVGHVECSGGVILAVDKWLDVRRDAHGRSEVRGVSYSYHAWRRNEHDLLRYDTAHGLDELHRHDFDPETGREIGVHRVPLEELPTLDGVIREAVALAQRSPDDRRPTTHD